MKMYEIRPGAAQESRAKLNVELDWLDSLLADGRQYLADGRFSRADITVASLLAPFARPEQMKTYHNLAVPRALTVDFECWKDRPIMRWIVERYRTDRAANSLHHGPLPPPEHLSSNSSRLESQRRWSTRAASSLTSRRRARPALPTTRLITRSSWRWDSRGSQRFLPRARPRGSI